MLVKDFNMNIVDKLHEYEQQGLVYSQVHPTLPLTIWNYSQKVQYEGLFDELTILARGLVTDENGIVSRGFPKFWSIEEGRHIPTDTFEVLEKLDGQYIGVFFYNGEMVVNSRGSFTSPYAIEAKRILEEKYPIFENRARKDVSYCFELIGFEQIVVSYPEVDLIMTGVFSSDGFEYELENYKGYFIQDNDLKVRFARRFHGLDYNNIKQLNWKNKEGFVVRFSNGQRCKIKFEDYIQLHRQMTNLSTTAIWEALRDGRPVSEILTDVPDEFYDKVHFYENELRNQFADVEHEHRIAFNSIKCVTGFDRITTDYERRNFAYHANKSKSEILPSILFSMLDGKNYSKLIWNAIKPKFEKI